MTQLIPKILLYIVYKNEKEVEIKASTNSSASADIV